MSCPNQQQNAAKCNCSYPCSRKGNCCECIRYHRSLGQLPACYFKTEFEKTYDRSIDNYLRQSR
ncbi:MAG: hypothetical protein FJ042_07895 [Candidatus Cloacimonetes bacterium]|nr:hypothetical protein [Candidatus Cloacimonadota bacterium]